MIKYGLSALYRMLGAALTTQYTLRPQGMPFRVSAPPEDPRYWHDPTDAKHLDRMHDAERRREVRAEKLTIQTKRTVMNSAHFQVTEKTHDETTYGVPNRLNPFYVAK